MKQQLLQKQLDEIEALCKAQQPTNVLAEKVLATYEKDYVKG